MEKEYWARLYSKGAKSYRETGPWSTREIALEQFRIKYPGLKLQSPNNRIMSGYGTFGPSFDIQWDAY